MKLNKLTHIAVIAALASLYGAQAHAASPFSAPVVTQDTATNLAVSWIFDTSLTTIFPEGSAASLSNWSAEAWGWTQSLRGKAPVYVIDILADKNVSAFSFEYEAGTFANSSTSVLFHNTSLISGRTYTLDIIQDKANAKLWDVNLTAVTAVPEPESYAMLLAGLGLMGTIARRRNKAAKA